jgi:pimeloyl-ACP methyl ester carboxylesterase
LVLLHWSPGCGRMFEPFIPTFVERGYSVYAPDVMGMGRSDERPSDWRIEDMAENMGEALDALGLNDVYLVAGHLTGMVGTELMLQKPGRVKKLALDGAPAWTDEERHKLLSSVSTDAPTVQEDGSHKTYPWDRAIFSLQTWNKSFELNNDTLPDVYLMAIDCLEQRFGSPADAIGQYDIRPRLPLLDLPVLALTADRELLRSQHDGAVALIKDCKEHCFPGDHPLMSPDRADEYVSVIDDFFRG